MSCEEGVLTVQGDGADGAFDGIAVDLDAAIGEEAARQAVTRSAGVETAVDTGVPVVAATTCVLQLRVNAAGTSAEFLINGSVAATIATNIPTGAGRETAYGVYGQKTVGVTSVNPFDLDYALVELAFGER